MVWAAASEGPKGHGVLSSRRFILNSLLTPGAALSQCFNGRLLSTCPKVIIVLLITMSLDARPFALNVLTVLFFPHVFRVHNCETRMITLTRLFLMLFDCFLDTSGETSAVARMCFPLAFHCQSQSPQTLRSHRHSSGEHLRCCNCTHAAGSRSRSIKLRTWACGFRWREYRSSSYWKEIAVVIISQITRWEQCADCTTKPWPHWWSHFRRLAKSCH